MSIGSNEQMKLPLDIYSFKWYTVPSPLEYLILEMPPITACIYDHMWVTVGDRIMI